MSREFLITKFACAKCGGGLELSYDLPNHVDEHREGEPTGAAMVQQVVAIKPCFVCMKPSKEVAAALRTILTAAKESA